MKKVLYFATGSSSKFEEVKRYIGKHEPSIELLQYSGDIEEIQSLDQKTIAVDKVKKAWLALRQPVIVDDAGVYFTAYKNFPGTFAKFIYHSLGLDGIFRLIDNNNNGAYFSLTLVYVDSDESCKIFEGRCDGTIVSPSRVAARPDFPWHAIFLPNGSKKIYSEMFGTPEFDAYSARIQALQKFLDWFNVRNHIDNKANMSKTVE
jgi:XTP/dITP diphosphohydrolase